MYDHRIRREPGTDDTDEVRGSFRLSRGQSLMEHSVCRDRVCEAERQNAEQQTGASHGQERGESREFRQGPSPKMNCLERQLTCSV